MDSFAQQIEELMSLRVPSVEEVQRFLAEAEALNPGPWVAHSRYVGQGAEILARHHPVLDGAVADALGCLHDIGRRAGVSNLRHVLDGYRFMLQQGYDDVARICLTHSFPSQDLREFFGEVDCSAEETAFIARRLAEIHYTDYDRLIQLCDALALPTGFCLMEKRMVDVALRYGPNGYTVAKWRATFQIKADLERAIGRSLYSLLPGVVENTFGLSIAELAQG